VQTARSPTVAHILDWESKTLRQWTYPASPEIDTGSFALPVLESYPARDGARIPMWVRRPKACEAPCPVIVNFHGGPESQAVAGFSSTSQVYVDAGFVYVQPNVRGSDGYGKTWLDADNGPKRLDVISDLEDAARYIRSAWAVGGVAPKIGVNGGSYGGYAVLMAMTLFAGSYDAGVSVVGISDLRTFLMNTAPYRRALRATEYGDPEKDKEALGKLSAMTYLDRVQDPLLLIQGVSDPRVPVGEALRIHDALEAKGIPTELILFPDEGHGAQRRDNVAYQIGYTLRFYQQHLQGKAAPQAPN
jgi:dipeptidyl aminopeptidase/acylaminoacyl peptidase